MIKMIVKYMRNIVIPALSLVFSLSFSLAVYLFFPIVFSLVFVLAGVNALPVESWDDESACLVGLGGGKMKITEGIYLDCGRTIHLRCSNGNLAYKGFEPVPELFLQCRGEAEYDSRGSAPHLRLESLNAIPYHNLNEMLEKGTILLQNESPKKHSRILFTDIESGNYTFTVKHFTTIKIGVCEYTAYDGGWRYLGFGRENCRQLLLSIARNGTLVTTSKNVINIRELLQGNYVYEISDDALVSIARNHQIGLLEFLQYFSTITLLEFLNDGEHPMLHEPSLELVKNRKMPEKELKFFYQAIAYHLNPLTVSRIRKNNSEFYVNLLDRLESFRGNGWEGALYDYENSPCAIAFHFSRHWPYVDDAHILANDIVENCRKITSEENGEGTNLNNAKDSVDAKHSDDEEHSNNEGAVNDVNNSGEIGGNPKKPEILSGEETAQITGQEIKNGKYSYAGYALLLIVLSLFVTSAAIFMELQA